jgi:hypothetical protein
VLNQAAERAHRLDVEPVRRLVEHQRLSAGRVRVGHRLVAQEADQALERDPVLERVETVYPQAAPTSP